MRILKLSVISVSHRCFPHWSSVPDSLVPDSLVPGSLVPGPWADWGRSRGFPPWPGSLWSPSRKPSVLVRCWASVHKGSGPRTHTGPADTGSTRPPEPGHRPCHYSRRSGRTPGPGPGPAGPGSYPGRRRASGRTGPGPDPWVCPSHILRPVRSRPGNRPTTNWFWSARPFCKGGNRIGTGLKRKADPSKTEFLNFFGSGLRKDPSCCRQKTQFLFGGFVVAVVPERQVRSQKPRPPTTSANDGVTAPNFLFSFFFKFKYTIKSKTSILFDHKTLFKKSNTS